MAPKEPKDDARSNLPPLDRFRESTLWQLYLALKPNFETKTGRTLPEKVRISIGVGSAGARGKRLSESWPSSASEDETTEIFISPTLCKLIPIAIELQHQMIHACLEGQEAGHGPKFKDAFARLGYFGNYKDPKPGPDLLAFLEDVCDRLNPLHHARLNVNARVLDRQLPVDRPKPQKGRLKKIVCDGVSENGQPCDLIVRISRKCLEKPGMPCCPLHGPMRLIDDDEPPSVDPIDPLTPLDDAPDLTPSASDSAQPTESEEPAPDAIGLIPSEIANLSRPQPPGASV